MKKRKNKIISLLLALLIFSGAFSAFAGSSNAVSETEPSDITNSTESVPEETKVKLKKSSITLYVNQTAKINAQITNPVGETSYLNSHREVAEVDSSGKITALKKGSTEITVLNNKIKALLKVNVKEPKLNKTSISLEKGRSFKISVIGKAGTPIYKSSNKKIAEVSASGKVKAKKTGKAYISVRTNGTNLKLNVKVINKILLLGHRGYSGKYPESTLEAFKGAFEKGFNGIECDVWETNSGDILVHHDPTTTRLTGKKQYIWRLSKKTRYKYPIKKGKNIKKYKSKKLIIPTLEEVAKLVSNYKGYINVHIKFDDKYHMSEKGVKKILKILHKYNLEKKALIFGVMNYVKPFINKGFKTGIYASPKTKSQLQSMAKWCSENGAGTIVFADIKRIKLYKSAKSLNNYCKKLKLKYGLYSTNSKKEYEFLCENGAQFAMSDNYLRY